ncbi:hypothetical protein AAKU67_003000 [Oxalobacteraceae bacterium GrIS 2.11]
MRHVYIFASVILFLAGLSACSKTEQPAAKPADDVFSTQKEELQKARDVQKVVDQQFEEQRKVIEVQTK